MKKFPKINLHIHSDFSDGKNSIMQIVESALKSDLEYIAITDHFTDSWKEWVSSLKNEEKVSEYLRELVQAQNFLKEKKKKLMLLKGLEIDLSSSENFIRKIQPSRFDLILFEYLENVETLAFLKNILTFWKRKSSNMVDFPILGLAHFDPSFFIYDNLDILIFFLKDNNIYFEFNPRYPNYYSRRNLRFFEEIKDANIPVGIGCDSHKNINLDHIHEPLEMISYYNLENNFQILLDILRTKFNVFAENGS